MDKVSFNLVRFCFICESDDPSFTVCCDDLAFATELLKCVTSRFSFCKDLYDFEGILDFVHDDETSYSEHFYSVPEFINRIEEIIT